jgi:hypothetical protein
MNNRTLSAFAFASVLALLSGPSHAVPVPLTFDFSFTGTVPPGNVPGLVTGEIDGLVDNTAHQSATAFIITTAPTGLKLTTPFTVLFRPGFETNLFDVSSGSITSSDVLVTFVTPLGPIGFMRLVKDSPFSSNVSQLSNNNCGPVCDITATANPPTFTQHQVPSPVTGAGLPGLILACGILLAFARRRRRQLVA